MHVIKWILVNTCNGIHRVFLTTLHGFMYLAYYSRGRKVPSVEDPILLISATELAEKIREGELTSERVVRAYIDRISTVDPFINATVERRFKEALQEAAEVDALIQSGTVDKLQLAKEKPLLGVPFTVKLLLTVKGMRKTCGSLLYKDEVADEDAPTVALMKEAGAIVLATTNIPEFGQNIETDNRVHGATSNPYDTSKISGGSSGGEAALLAAAGSVIGLGNDIGGSVRIPSMFCGVFGHKPTRGLVPNKGCFLPPPETFLRFVYSGPMCRYAQDLMTMIKILSTPNSMVEQKISLENINIYYLYSLENTALMDKVDPDMKECVQNVVCHFATKYGSQVKEISIPLLKKSVQIGTALATTLVPNYGRFMTNGTADVSATKELVKFLIRQSKYTLGSIAFLSLYKAANLIHNKQSLQYYLEKAKQLDNEMNNLLDERSILVMPTLPIAAPYHKEGIFHLISAVSYCGVFNVSGQPVTQCPVGFSRKGLPLGVQIVGRKGNDHLTIACAIELEKAFGGWKPPN